MVWTCNREGVAWNCAYYTNDVTLHLTCEQKVIKIVSSDDCTDIHIYKNIPIPGSLHCEIVL